MMLGSIAHDVVAARGCFPCIYKQACLFSFNQILDDCDTVTWLRCKHVTISLFLFILIHNVLVSFVVVSCMVGSVLDVLCITSIILPHVFATVVQ